MRQRKIHPGNAESVINRGRNVTIVPFDGESSIQMSSVERRNIRWPNGIDVIGGGAPDNPDNIDVSSNLYPGWRIYAYDCANSPCTATETEPLWIEVLNQLGNSWVSAYMVLQVSHVGATPTDYLFRVTELSIRSVISDLTAVDLTYAGALGMVNTVGLYIFQIAATASDGSKRMTMFTNAPGWLASVNNSDLVEQGFLAGTNSVDLYAAGLFERYDGGFMYPTGPYQDAGSVDIPFIIRYTP